jgi:hypothetical protein
MNVKNSIPHLSYECLGERAYRDTVPSSDVHSYFSRLSQRQADAKV